MAKLYVNDVHFEKVYLDIKENPLTDMNSISYRTRVPYSAVATAVRIMVNEGAVIRSRSPVGCPATYINVLA